MTTQLAPNPVFRGTDAFGLPLYLGQLGTFVAGTNTPQVTYKDSLGIATNTNPVILNTRGECNLWLDPTKAYKLVLSDALGNLIWTVDNVTIGNANPSFNVIPTVDNLFTLGSTTFSWANVYVGPSHAPVLDTATGNIGYSARTPAETTAGVTPTSFAYPFGDVRRYGAKGDGVTDDTAAFQAAINVCRVAGGAVIIPSPATTAGFYLILSALNVSITGQPNDYGVLFRGDAGSAAKPSIVLKHTGHGFDLTGANSITFENLNITTDNTTFPKTCFFLARNVTVGSAGHHVFINVQVRGKFSQALYYNYASEDDKIIGCVFYNYGGVAGAAVVMWTGRNRYALTSTFQTVAASPPGSSCIDHQVIGGEFFNQTHDAAADVFYIESSDFVKILCPWCACGDGTGGGRSHIFVDFAFNPSNYLTVFGYEGENNVFLPGFGIATTNDAATPTGWDIRQCRFPNATFAIDIKATPILDGSIIEHIYEQTSHGIQIEGTLQGNSTINVGAMVMTIGTCKQSTLIGDSSRWTVGTRSNDCWIDSGAVNKSFTPALGTMTHGGVLTVNENRFQLNGNMADFEFILTDTVSLTATAAQTIIGLPFAASRRSALVLVANESTGLAIGAAFIESGATSIKMPAFTVGAGVSVCVSGRYFVA